MTLTRWLTYAVIAAGTMLTTAAPASAQVAIPQPSPIPAPGWAYQWVPPAYRTVMDRIWVGQQVQMVADWVQTSPGRWEQIWRQVVIPGHWDSTSRQMLVSQGYWQLVRIDSAPLPMPPSIFARSQGTVGVDGYSSGPGEDLSKFSPLADWPVKQ